MLPPKVPLPPDQQYLLKLFRQLSDPDRHSLVAYAEFLLSRTAQDALRAVDEVPPPLPIPRPASESVVAAMRRLAKAFPMLDKDALLHEASALMTAHVMQGRPAADVIDELEVVFRRHYERVKSSTDQP